MTTHRSSVAAGSHRGQLTALVGMRWTMLRSNGIRVALVALAFLPPVATVMGVLLFQFVPEEQAFTLSLVAPTLYLAFVLLAILAPLAAGGGYELFPNEQLVAYPIRPRTHFFSTLVLVPANLAWVLNVMALVVVTSVTTGALGWGTVRSTVSVLAYVALITVAGHAFAWWVVGVRQTRVGRLATWTLAATAGITILAAVRAGLTFPVLDRSPTKYALLNAYAGFNGEYLRWTIGLAVLAAGTVTLLAVGVRATAWSLRRPGDHGLRDASQPVRRRAPQTTPLRTLVAVDRASVWRAVPLRRGLIVLMIMPGAVAAFAALSWQSLVLLPGLVAAGAALLFGINAFALDASGSTWLATTPGWAKPAFVAKSWMVTEVTLLAVAAALVGGSLRAPAPLGVSQVTATAGCGLAATALVVASAMRSSIRHPHRADLRGPRDTPAPPGSMALYSVKLASITTLVGLLFSGVAFTDVWWVPLVLVVPFIAWAGLSLADTMRAWQEPATRARIVTTVSGG